MDVNELASYLNIFLKVDKFKDYAPNGLQVEGKSEIKTIVTGVTACEALIDQAVKLNADAILVHHGYFWNGEKPQITGIKRNRIAKLLKHDINLLAYHLPLDAHEKIGNNKKLADLLDIKITGSFIEENGESIGFVGNFLKVLTAEKFCEKIKNTLKYTPLHIGEKQEEIKTIAWCSGGAQKYIELAIEKKVDAYLTGEASEATTHFARESKIHFFGCGHHATERYGVKSLGEHLATKFKLEHHFIDIPNPV